MASKHSDSIAVYERVGHIIREGQSAALAIVVATSGSTPGLPGFKMLISPDETIIGTVGGGELETRIIKESKDVIERNTPKFLEVDLTPMDRDNLGMICGGKAKVYIEPIVPREKAIIFGAGHVGIATAQIAKIAGFRVTIVDDRADFAEAAKYAADEVLVCDFEKSIEKLQIDSRSYIVIVTRGHSYDKETLAACLKRNPPYPTYIGMIGSKAKIRKIFDMLEEEGVSKEAIQKVHSPIGLSIKAKTAQEIAVAIVAEMISVKNNDNDRD
ncbi:MAG: xanthine dehydrogenase [Clostridium sp.]|nr:xanthine dehydrogenase [Clostridium sp.]